MKTETEYEKVKKSLKYRFYRFCWVLFKNLGNSAGHKCVDLLRKTYERE